MMATVRKSGRNNRDESSSALNPACLLNYTFNQDRVLF